MNHQSGGFPYCYNKSKENHLNGPGFLFFVANRIGLYLLPSSKLEGKPERPKITAWKKEFEVVQSFSLGVHTCAQAFKSESKQRWACARNLESEFEAQSTFAAPNECVAMWARSRIANQTSVPVGFLLTWSQFRSSHQIQGGQRLVQYYKKL